MSKKLTSFFVLFLTLAIIGSNFFYSAKFSLSAAPESAYVPDEILVKFKDNSEIIAVKIAQSSDFKEILNYYQKMPFVEYAEPNYTYKASIIPSDTYFGNQWYLKKIKAVEAWNSVRESQNIVIAILDSGVQIKHPDLKDNIWINKKETAGNNIDDDKNGFIDDINGWDFINNSSDPSPKFQAGFNEEGINHGTIIAGIAGASGNNAAGVAGISWKVKLMPLKVLEDNGEGGTLKVVKAIDYAIANGANIINLSFVGFGYSKSLDDAIKRAYEAGVIVVAAGGNEQGQGDGYNLDETPMYPACLDGANGENRVIGVAATDTIDQKAPFSSFGSKCIDIAAPGVSAYSTVVYEPTKYLEDKSFNTYYDGYWSGTSVAVPIISASLALIESANPSLSRDEVISTLLNTADNISAVNPNYFGKLGRGRVNLASAVSQAQTSLKNKKEELLVGPMAGLDGPVKITNQDGAVIKEFYPFGKFKGGVSLASGDINGDGQSEIIAAAGPGGGPHVKIFNLNGEVVGQFFAFKEKFRGGLKVASADVNNDGKDEIIITAASSGDSEIKIFNGRGGLLGSFYAYNNKFKGGLNIAAGDIDADGEPEIITGLGAGKAPEVRIFEAIGTLQGQFLAYQKTFLGGVEVAVANIKGGAIANRALIITAPGKGGGPHIRIFDNKGNVAGQFFAFNSNFRGGVDIAKADVDNDGLDEIIAAAGPGGAPHVRVFESDGRIIGSFYAYAANFSGGASVSSIKVNQ